MIDWFVLLIPLVLLPIFLLFVFVGCVLNKEGTAGTAGPDDGTPVTLTYPDGLDADVQSLEVWFTIPTPAEGDSSFGGTSPPFPFSLSGSALTGAGTVVGPTVSLNLAGWVTCGCIITLIPASILPEITKQEEKTAGENTPTFTLSGTQGAYSLT